MSLKKIIPFLFGTTILASGAISLASSSTNFATSSNLEQVNFVRQTSSLNEDSVLDKKQEILLETQNSLAIKLDESTVQKLMSTVKSVYSSDKNYYQWYYLYHVIGLSNEVLKVVNEYYSDGVSAILSVISYMIPAFAPFAPALALLLNLQWSYWELDKYANEGKDVELKCLGGVVPQVIISVKQQ